MPQYKNTENGVWQVELKSWKDFGTIVNDNLLDLPYYIFRGHRRNDWLLESNLARLLKRKAIPQFDRKKHLKNFKYATRGRRGLNPPEISDYEWWALGQHFGLSTPLLDWTTSPYVGLFFAFEEEAFEEATDTRVVFALNQVQVEEKCAQMKVTNQSCEDSIEFIKSLSDENSRLVTQAGIFTMLPDHVDLESWIRQHFEQKYTDKVVLMKIYIPNKDREGCLKALNKMNINHSTLFPDLIGSSRYANFQMEISNY